MPRHFWIKRLIISFVVAFAALTIVQMAKGTESQPATIFGLIWGAIAAVIFTGIGYYRFRKNPACMTKID